MDTINLNKLVEQRPSILDKISSGQRLFALIIVVAELVVLVAFVLTPSSDQTRVLFIYVFLFLLLVLAVGFLIDQQLARNAEAKRMELVIGPYSVSPSPERTTSQEIDTQANNAFIDSNKEFKFNLPSSDLWSEPGKIGNLEYMISTGLLPENSNINEMKERLNVMPFGQMLSESEVVFLEYGKPIQVELTEASTSRAVEALLERMIARAEHENKSLSEEEIVEIRRNLLLGNLGDFERIKVQNRFLVTILDKSLAVNSPISATLANVFLYNQRLTGGAVDQLVAEKGMILWGQSDTITNVLVDGQPREFTGHTLSQMKEGKKYFYVTTIFYTPQSEATIDVWTELKTVFESFQVIE